MSKHFLITGTPRSGTTLIEKLIHSHPMLEVFSQPFPLLYIESKKRFYKKIEHKEDFAYLNHMFKENLYSIEQFSKFLTQDTYSKSEVLQVLLSMKGNKMQSTEIPNPALLCNNIALGNIDSILSQLLYKLGQDKSLYIGSKEALNEEYIPFLIESGYKVILIIRDPRDVLSSMNRGKGELYYGDIRPTLFNIRNWRKSVAYAIEFEDDKNFLLIQYENLIENPTDELNAVFDFLNVGNISAEHFSETIKDQDGNEWKSNSSFVSKSNITKDSIGTYKKELDESTVKYIETVAGPEMIYLGYLNSFANNYEDIINSFKEPFSITRKEIPIDYSETDENKHDEILRLKNILSKKKLSKEDINSNYLFLKSYIIYKKLLDLD
jgi:hypothetical protein